MGRKRRKREGGSRGGDIWKGIGECNGTQNGETRTTA